MSRSLLVGPLLHLRTLPAFGGISSHHLTLLAQEVEEVVVERGMVLLNPGQPAQDVHVVVDGLVDLRRGDVEGSVGPGEAVGFLELLAQGPSGSEARAQVDTVALRMDGDALREVCERHFAVLDSLLSNVSRGVTEQPRALRRAVQGDTAAWRDDLRRPLDRVGRMLALHRSPVFPSASMDALAELAGHLEEVEIQPGDPLWRVGDPAESFFLVCSGTVRYVNRTGGWSVEVGRGGVPGLPGTLARGHRVVEAEAMDRVVALRMGIEPFLDILEDHFEMAWELLGRLAGCVLAAGGS